MITMIGLSRSIQDEVCIAVITSFLQCHTYFRQCCQKPNCTRVADPHVSSLSMLPHSLSCKPRIVPAAATESIFSTQKDVHCSPLKDVQCNHQNSHGIGSFSEVSQKRFTRSIAAGSAPVINEYAARARPLAPQVLVLALAADDRDVTAKLVAAPLYL
jgi:hypothetical protein